MAERGRGRPSRIDEISTTRIADDGTTIEVTISERIVELLRAGNYAETAAAAVGIPKETFYGWLRVGAATRSSIIAGQRTRTQFTKHEQRCFDFSDAVAQAEAEWEATALTTLERIGRGGATVEVTTVKEALVDGQMRVVERQVRSERLPASAQPIEWRLTRRFPERYSNRLEVAEVSSSEQDDLAAALLAAFLDGAATQSEVDSERNAHVTRPGDPA